MSESKNGVPAEFYSASHDRVFCETVSEVIKQLGRLPPDMPVDQGFGNGVMLIVYNINDNPHLEFEEDNQKAA